MSALLYLNETVLRQEVICISPVTYKMVAKQAGPSRKSYRSHISYLECKKKTRPLKEAISTSQHFTLN